jgi:hypothetical protein
MEKRNAPSPTLPTGAFAIRNEPDSWTMEIRYAMKVTTKE